jgi:hypothetical protein
MDSPSLDNRTDFAVFPHVLAGKEGEQLVVIVKATFLRVPGEAALVFASPREQRRVRAADVPWGDPSKSSIKYPSDLCISKPGTDVIVVAAAHAPGGKPVPHFDAGVRAGPLEKTLRVFGLRVWEGGGAGLSAPRPTTGMEVRYDHAWGGADFTDPQRPVEEARNPVGTGVARDPASLTHRPAPFIEDPAQPIRTARTAPPPAGLGVVGRHWEPRLRLWGTHDAAWLSERAPLLPRDFDDRANLCASPGLSAAPPLSGGEDVALLNLTPGGGTVRFRLPKIRVTVDVARHGKRERRAPHLDTVILDTLDVKRDTTRAHPPADVWVELVWRAAFGPPGRMRDVEITVTEEEVP